MTRTRITLEIGADFDACLSEAPRNDRLPSLVVHSGQIELVLTLGKDAPVDACDRLGEALSDWRASHTEMSPP